MRWSIFGRVSESWDHSYLNYYLLLLFVLQKNKANSFFLQCFSIIEILSYHFRTIILIWITAIPTNYYNIRFTLIMPFLFHKTNRVFICRVTKRTYTVYRSSIISYFLPDIMDHISIEFSLDRLFNININNFINHFYYVTLFLLKRFNIIFSSLLGPIVLPKQFRAVVNGNNCLDANIKRKIIIV